MRPGERPFWADASPWDREWDEWRQGARARGLSLDVALACLLEYTLTIDELASWTARPEAELRAAAGHEMASPRLPPGSELQTWSGLLTGRSAGSHHELPDVVFPSRLLQNNPLVRGDWGSRIAVKQLDDALLCERAACRRGLTLEGWALRVTLQRLALRVGR
jgi:hypothetical protein